MAALEIPEDALNRLHHVINERRKGTTSVKVNVEDLKALLYASAKLAGREITLQ